MRARSYGHWGGSRIEAWPHAQLGAGDSPERPHGQVKRGELPDLTRGRVAGFPVLPAELSAAGWPYGLMSQCLYEREARIRGFESRTYGYPGR